RRARIWISQAYATLLRSGQCIAGTSADTLSLILSYSSDDMQRQPVRLQHIDGHEINAGFHQVGNEGQVTRKAIKTGNHQHSAILTAGSQGKRQLRALVLLTAFNLGKLFGNAAMPGNISSHRLALCIEAQTAFPLPVGGYTEISDK